MKRFLGILLALLICVMPMVASAETEMDVYTIGNLKATVMGTEYDFTGLNIAASTVETDNGNGALSLSVAAGEATGAITVEFGADAIYADVLGSVVTVSYADADTFLSESGIDLGFKLSDLASGNFDPTALFNIDLEQYLTEELLTAIMNDVAAAEITETDEDFFEDGNVYHVTTTAFTVKEETFKMVLNAIYQPMLDQMKNNAAMIAATSGVSVEEAAAELEAGMAAIDTIKIPEGLYMEIVSVADAVETNIVFASCAFEVTEGEETVSLDLTERICVDNTGAVDFYMALNDTPEVPLLDFELIIADEANGAAYVQICNPEDGSYVFGGQIGWYPPEDAKGIEIASVFTMADSEESTCINLSNKYNDTENGSVGQLVLYTFDAEENAMPLATVDYTTVEEEDLEAINLVADVMGMATVEMTLGETEVNGIDIAMPSAAANAYNLMTLDEEGSNALMGEILTNGMGLLTGIMEIPGVAALMGAAE